MALFWDSIEQHVLTQRDILVKSAPSKLADEGKQVIFVHTLLSDFKC